MVFDVKKNIIIDIPFNIDLSAYIQPQNYIYPKLKMAYERSQRREWIERRIALFIKYTANSLIQQTSQDFICLVRCTRQSEKIIHEVLKQYTVLPSHIIFTSSAEQIIDESVRKNKHLYRVVIDSDNMYDKSFIEHVHTYKHKEETLSLVCQKGYVYEEKSEKVGYITHPSPSCYVQIYNQETYNNLYPKRVFEDHWEVLGYPCEIIRGRYYCICIHEQNVDNVLKDIIRNYKGEEILGILKEQFFMRWHLKE